MFAMAKIMEMTKEEQNQVAMYLLNNIKINEKIAKNSIMKKREFTKNVEN